MVRMIKSRRLRWASHVARMEECRSAFKILSGKPIEKRTLGRPRRRWEDIIRMDLKEIGISTRNSADWTQDREKIQHPKRPVENVVITTKGLQERKTQILNGTTVEK